MNVEDRNILAKWIGWDPPIDFCPYLDSNHLDMLEDKMLDECAIELLEIERGGNINEHKFVLVRGYATFNSEQKLLVDGKGKTKNEARLNAILNYVKGVAK